MPAAVGRLLTVLAADRYAPIRIAELCHEIFPGEHFNPPTSPARVHELVRRARTALKTTRMPLTILGENGAYRMQPTGAVSILLPGSQANDTTPLRVRLESAF